MNGNKFILNKIEKNRNGIIGIITQGCRINPLGYGRFLFVMIMTLFCCIQYTLPSFKVNFHFQLIDFFNCVFFRNESPPSPGKPQRASSCCRSCTSDIRLQLAVTETTITFTSGADSTNTCKIVNL